MESINLHIELSQNNVQLTSFKHSFQPPAKDTAESRQEYMRHVVAGLAASKQESDRVLTALIESQKQTAANPQWERHP